VYVVRCWWVDSQEAFSMLGIYVQAVVVCVHKFIEKDVVSGM
jgi:hypothetical protein